MIVIVMGVSGSGKTEVGRRLAEDLGWEFHEGDDFHPPANIEKMSRGVALTDRDRGPWLETLRGLIEDRIRRGVNAVIACSALRQDYRDRLGMGRPGVNFVYLCGGYDLIYGRLAARRGHFVKEGLLASQFAALEEPRGVLTLDVSEPPDRLARRIRDEFVARMQQRRFEVEPGDGDFV